MILDLFPEQVTAVAIQRTEPESWAERNTLGKKRYGARCTMCVRGNMWFEDVLKPMLVKRTDPDDERVLLMVVDTTTFSDSINTCVRYIRETGFGGQIVVDLAVRCGGGRQDQVKPEHADKCRPHIAFTYRASRPTHILLCGTKATLSVLGSTIMVQKNRACWQVIEEDGQRIPVVSTVSTVDATGNYIFRRNFKAEVHQLINTDWDSVPRWEGTVRLVENAEDVTAFKKWVKARIHSWLAFDTETVGQLFNPGFRVICIAFAHPQSKETWAFGPEQMRDPDMVALCDQVLTHPHIGKVGQNVKYDMHAWKQFTGSEVTPIEGCSRLLYKLNNAEGDADLEAIGATVGIGQHKAEAAEALKEALRQVKEEIAEEFGKKVKKYVANPHQRAYERLDVEVLVRYCALDTYTTAVAYEYWWGVTQGTFRENTWTRLVRPANRAFWKMEENGLMVDLTTADIVAHALTKEISAVEERIKLLDIDPDSPASIRAFFEREKLVSPYLSEKTLLPATHAKALTKMRSQHTVISDLLEYRKLSKLANSYLTSLPFHVRADSRVHPSILLDGARTGRLSMTDPALHGTPRDNKDFRKIYVAPKGRTLAAGDFKTLEVFIAAIWSQDKLMLDTLASGADFHTETAKRIAPFAWDMTPEECEADILADIAKTGKSPKRNMTKRTTFGILYGMGPDSLADQVMCSKKMAGDLINGVFGTYKDLRIRMDEQLKFARRAGFAYIPWGDPSTPARSRPLPYIGAPDAKRRINAENASINSVIQGWAADFCTASVISLTDIFEKDYAGRAQVNLSIHDAIIVECDDDIVQEVVDIMRSVMTGWPSAPLTLAVDFETGKTMGTMKPWTAH